MLRSAACREVAVLAALQDNGDDEDGEAAAAPAAAHGGRYAGTTPAAVAGLVVYSMDVKARSTRCRGGKAAATTGGRASTGGKSSRGRGKGASTGRGSKKAKTRRRKFDLSDSDGDEQPDSGDEDWRNGKKARKLFD